LIGFGAVVVVVVVGILFCFVDLEVRGPCALGIEEKTTNRLIAFGTKMDEERKKEEQGAL
jgi:hypothetical protein